MLMLLPPQVVSAAPKNPPVLQTSALKAGLLDAVEVKSEKGAWGSERFLRWSENDRKVLLRIKPGGSSSGKAALSVWAFGPPPTAPTLGKGSAPTTPPGGKARIVHTEEIQLGGAPLEISMDFASFAPSQGPKPSWSGYAVLSSDPVVRSLQQIAAAQRQQALDAALAEIRATGSVTYAVQLTTGSGAASTWATVRYGEPAPAPFRSLLETKIHAATAEFPEVWGSSASIGEFGNTLLFRWKTDAPAVKALVQIAKDGFPDGFATWNDPTRDVQRQFVDVPAKGGTASFQLPAAKLQGAPAGTVFAARIVPLTAENNLAGLPSPAVRLSVPAAAAKAPAPAASLAFEIELVGWEPAHLPIPDDAYHYVVAGTPDKGIYESVKKVAGQEPKSGVKVYLPPKPPEKEKAWYEKVASAIASVLHFLDTVGNVAQQAFGIVEGKVAKAPFDLADMAGLPGSKVKGGLDKAAGALNLAGAKLQQMDLLGRGADYVTGRMADDLGIQDPAARAAFMGKFGGAVRTWSQQNSYLKATAGVQGGLVPDPDFQAHPGIAWIRVRAKATGAVPAGFRQAPPAASLKVGVFARNAELLGIPAEYRDLFQATVPFPTLAVGEELLVPVVTQYHWSHEQQAGTWNFAINHAEKTRYELNGKAFFGTTVNSPWGQTGGK
ncbi:MAG: hypothetical protein IPL96_10730 [Holophagaceae bacterium]|nr:hypothetical protein [Holophagaceae bacterium]